MIFELTTEDEFKYHKWRDNYIVDVSQALIHMSHCETIPRFQQGSYYRAEDVGEGMKRFQAEKCHHCFSK